MYHFVHEDSPKRVRRSTDILHPKHSDLINEEHVRNTYSYSGTPQNRTPMGHEQVSSGVLVSGVDLSSIDWDIIIVSLIQGCPHFRDLD